MATAVSTAEGHDDDGYLHYYSFLVFFYLTLQMLLVNMFNQRTARRLAECKNSKLTRVIGLGLSRTGTSSFSLAMDILGYRAWHFTGISPDNMLDTHGFDCVSDLPHYRMAFSEADILPDAMYVLTVRDPEKWQKSLAAWCTRNWGWDIFHPSKPLPFLCPKYVDVIKRLLGISPPTKGTPRPPTNNPILRVLHRVVGVFNGITLNMIGSSPFSHINMMVHNVQHEYSEIFDGKIKEIMMNHRKRVEEIFKNHKDQLIIIDCTTRDKTDKEKWEILCMPLGIPVPNCAFPNESYEDLYYHQFSNLYYST